MTSKLGFLGAVTMAGLAISLTLSACGPQTGVEIADAGSAAPGVTSTATGEPTMSATVAPAGPEPLLSPAPSAVPAPQAPAPVEPVVPVEPVAPSLQSFTFPDGHISFSYPAGWSVRTERGPGRDGPPWQPVEAIVSDGTGNDLVRVSSGADGIGCAGGPVHRTVLDKADAPGMRQADGTTPWFGFKVENVGGEDWYSMSLSRPSNFDEGEVNSGCGLLVMENGGAMVGAIFNPPPHLAFPSREAAKAWMGSEQYSQLKALLLSVSYS
ncbi:hypothetical protein [Arthrobacter sp.]|uniref:hypothetical protein n=1 Tax=Arthrobacter sp. TaxID=1667 RepID=UPI0028124BCC|nr:hypothetical protein [Arthrobacter sp.]